jgi:uncharacterized protein with PIN domain
VGRSGETDFSVVYDERMETRSANDIGEGLTRAATSDPQFACDAMLGGLARWLRAAGYDAAWKAGIGDWDLIRLAQREGRVLLSSDSGIFRIGVVRDGDLSALLIPHGLLKHQQLAYVLRQLGLTPGEPRCMACGGILEKVPRDLVTDRAPPRTLAWIEQFFECSRCGQLFWKGTHWSRIEQVLEQAGRAE